MTREELIRRVEAAYDVAPDYPFPGDPVSAVFRHAPSRKWFALLMRVGGGSLGLPGDALLDILNLKCDPLLIGALRDQPGILPAYHMNKAHWITVLIDRADPEQVMALVEMSYHLTGGKRRQA